ncbi:MAG: phosphotransferase [Thermodesulfobacteriota bacterium]
MAIVAIPNSLAEINEAWLTDVLRSTETIKKARVTSCRIEPIGAGTGFMADLGRLHLTYDLKEEGAPQSLVVKVPASAPENLMVALTFSFYQREMNFYRYAAPISCLRTPRSYYLDVDQSGQKFVMLLEDLGPALLDQIKGASAENTYQAIIELAKFHVQFAPQVQKGEMNWLMDSADPGYVALNSGIYQMALEPALKNFGDHFNPSTRRVAENLYDKIPWLMTDRVKEALTLIHGDYRLDNMFMGKLPPRKDFPLEGLAVVDWQICCIAEGGFDVGYHMCSISTDTRREIERKSLETYYRILTENGIGNVPFPDFLVRYKRSILFTLLYGISVAGNLDLGNERGVTLTKIMLDRILLAIEDHQAGDLMP